MTTMEKTGFDVANALNEHTHVRIPEMLGLFVKDANLKIELLVSEQFCLSAGETDLPKLGNPF